MLGPLPDINAHQAERKVSAETAAALSADLNEMLFQEGLNAQKDRARKIFRRVDKDRGGNIDADEMPAMIRAIGLDVSDMELRRQGKKFLKKWDSDKSGSVDFNEFFYFYQHVLANEKKRRKYAKKVEKNALSNEQKTRGKEAFAKYDVDSSGTMNARELTHVITEELRLQLTPAEVTSLAEDVVRRGDKDGDGVISRDEFLVFYSQCLANDKKRRRYIKKLEERYNTVMEISDDALFG